MHGLRCRIDLEEMMISYCKCGGKMRPYVHNRLVFVWQCEKCGKQVEQRKRLSKMLRCEKCGHALDRRSER